MGKCGCVRRLIVVGVGVSRDCPPGNLSPSERALVHFGWTLESVSGGPQILRRGGFTPARGGGGSGGGGSCGGCGGGGGMDSGCGNGGGERAVDGGGGGSGDDPAR